MFSLNSHVFKLIHQELLIPSSTDSFLKHLKLPCGNGGGLCPLAEKVLCVKSPSRTQLSIGEHKKCKVGDPRLNPSSMSH